MAVEVEPSTNILVHFTALPQMAAERQPDKLALDVEVCTKGRCATEFLHVQEVVPTDTHQCLLNVDGDQTITGGGCCVPAVVTAM